MTRKKHKADSVTGNETFENRRRRKLIDRKEMSVFNTRLP